jgi:hypothetical protein
MPHEVPFPFVVGVNRSGTTLLRTMLDRHPRLAVPPESHFLTLLWKWRKRYITKAGFDLDRLRTDLMTLRRFRDWGLDPRWVRERLRGVERIDYPGAMRRIFSLYAEAHGKDRYGDKTPAYLLHMRLLSDIFPESRFVHLIRDGRDVSLSIIDSLPGSGIHRPWQAAGYWAYRIRKGQESGRALGAGRYLEIRYEDLVEDPEAVLRAVCLFLELDYSPQMLEGFQGAAERLPIDQRSRHRHVVRPPTKGIRDWRRDMDEWDVRYVECIAGRQLSELGYPVANRRLGPGVLLLSQLYRVLNASRSLINRLRTRLRHWRQRIRLPRSGAEPNPDPRIAEVG